jgi:hypothetical protein
MGAAFLDYDLDGDLDLYVLNNEQVIAKPTNFRTKITDGSAVNNDAFYRNNGDGTFTNVTLEAVGFRPALVGPGRPSRIAVCSPLCKPALRRLAASEPGAPPPPPLPAGSQPQPASQLQGAALQAAPSARQWWDASNVKLWHVKLVTLGVMVYCAVSYWQEGNPYSAVACLFSVFLVLLPPWSDFDD